MNYSSVNPYQLLFVEDDTDVESVGKEKLEHESKGQKKIKQKKIPRDKVKSVEMSNAKEQQQRKLKQQLQLELRQQQQLQQLEQKQQQQLQQRLQQTLLRERVYRERIINNSDRYYRGYNDGYVSAGGRDGGGDRPINDNTYNEQPKQQQFINQNENNLLNEEEEDESKYITVEEWRAMIDERAKPVYNIRKPGEGEPKKPKWEKMIALPKKKKQPQSKSDEDEYEYDASMYPQRVGRQQRIVDIDFKFKDDRRNRWSGRSFNNNSGSKHITESINMNSESEFPALG